MARLLLKALQQAGFRPALASELRTFDKTGNGKRQKALQRESIEAADRLIAQYRALAPADRPRLWFTYHAYHKSPDWIGLRVVEELGIPYILAETSHAAKQADGPWDLGYRDTQIAIDRASAIFVMTDKDRAGLPASSSCKLVDLPPFLDDTWTQTVSSPASEAREGDPDTELSLLTVAMMREGDKLRSYRLLAQSLTSLQDIPWRLDIVGDGEAKELVEASFAPLGARVRFYGSITDREALENFYDRADLYVWPAVNEAYGMAFLEAGARGCPAVAGAYGGVASVVCHNETGLLTPPGDASAFAAAVRDLLEDGSRRRQYGAAAQRFVSRQRSLTQAARILRQTLTPLCAEQTR